MVNSKGTNQEATMESTARLRVVVLLILIVMGLVSSLGTAWRTGDWEGLFLNLGTEMLGAVATYVLLELFIGGRERREAKKAALIAQLGSSVKDVAVAAAEELQRHGWLYDGSLKWADLERANLQGAYLSDACLRRAWLPLANLQGADLSKANLKGADLSNADLQKAKLNKAGLVAANLFSANLQGATLKDAALQYARLEAANLQGATFSVYTTLPDGTEWTLDTDMARFTDPDHPDFYCPLKIDGVMTRMPGTNIARLDIKLP
jgi:hypothetical protein